MTRRIAMWSGPRNISTALMRSWENRSDCTVIDEPFYAFYLAKTGLQHPGRADVLASQSHNWKEVASTLCGAVPDGANIWYQKHMAHHLLEGVGKDWMRHIEHCFLIRNPEAVISSYLRTRTEVTLPDLGVVQQNEIFRWLSNNGNTNPIVVDSADLLNQPETTLRAICKRLQLPFQQSMLRWPNGPRETDGVWAPHWYDNVLRSTGFLPYRDPQINIPPQYEFLVAEAMPYYLYLYEHRIRT